MYIATIVVNYLHNFSIFISYTNFVELTSFITTENEYGFMKGLVKVFG